MEERIKILLEKHKDDKDLTSEKENIYPGMDWSGANLSNYNLSDLCLSDFHLQANFSGAILREAILEECTLTGANFQNSNCCKAHFENAELGYANFRNARMVEAHLNHAKIQYVKLEDAILHDAFLEDATVVFSNLENADFRGADLSKANFANSNLEKVKFNKETKLHNVRLFNCNLEKSTLKNAVNNLDKIIIEERENKYEEGKQIYLLLKNYFKQEGLHDISGEYYYREKIMENKCYRKEKKWSNLLFNILLNLVAGYGEKPLRVLIWWVSIIFGFTSIYFFCNGIYNGIASSITSYNPNFSEALYFSVVTFTTLGFGDLAPKPGFFQIFASFEALLGAIFMAMFIYVFARKMAR